MATEQFANNATSTLNGTITSSQTTLLVNSAALFPSVPQFRIIIDSEIMLVTNVSGTTFTVTRGVENTAQASHNNGATVAMILTAGALDQLRSDLMSIENIGHRLTLTTGTPVTIADVVGAGTIYLTPYKSTKIPLYNGSIWQQFSTSEISLALTITSGSNYDVFAFNNSGTVALELSAPWTNNTTRADILAQQDGVWVKSSNHTRRYLGTIRASGTNTTEDSGTNRLLYNFYNQLPVVAFTSLTTNTGTVPDQSVSYLDIVSTTVFGQCIEIHGHVSGLISAGSNSTAYMRVLIDNVLQNHFAIYFEIVTNTAGGGNSILNVASNLSAGFHTFKLQLAKSGPGTISLSAATNPTLEGAWLVAKPYAISLP